MTDRYQQKLEAIASSVGIKPALLEQYLHDQLDPFKRQLFFEGGRRQTLIQALSADNEGVFYVLVSPSIADTSAVNATSDYIGVILDAIKQETTQHGFSTQYRVNNTHLANENYFRSVLEKHPDAGIISIIPERASTIEAVCAEMQRPCLLLDYPAHSALDTTYTLNLDNNEAIQIAMDYLFELGHRRIGFITGNIEFFSANERFNGYRDALKKANIDYDETLVKHGDWQSSSTEPLALELMSLENPPTAIVTSNDLMAFGVIVALHSHGYGIPEDVSLIGFDDIPMAATITPSLTTLRQPLELMGKQAGEIMVQILKRDEQLEHHHHFSAELIVRKSTTRLSIKHR